MQSNERKKKVKKKIALITIIWRQRKLRLQWPAASQLLVIGILILIGLNGAEGEILGRRGALGQHIKERRLSNVGHADDADAQVGANASDQRLAFRLIVLLRWHIDCCRCKIYI